MSSKNSKHVLGIIGSPRQQGNTDLLVDEVLKGVKDAGGTTSKIFLDALDIRPCKGCFTCDKTGVCVQEDDMAELVEQMKTSQVWVLGTPIYWWGPSAQFKAFLDRWVSISREHFRRRRVVLTIPMGGGSESYARHTVGMLRDVFDYLGIQLVATILAPGFGRRGEVKTAHGILEEARKAGKNAAT